MIRGGLGEASSGWTRHLPVWGGPPPGDCGARSVACLLPRAARNCAAEPWGRLRFGAGHLCRMCRMALSPVLSPELRRGRCFGAGLRLGTGRTRGRERALSGRFRRRPTRADPGPSCPRETASGAGPMSGPHVRPPCPASMSGLRVRIPRMSSMAEVAAQGDPARDVNSAMVAAPVVMRRGGVSREVSTTARLFTRSSCLRRSTVGTSPEPGGTGRADRAGPRRGDGEAYGYGERTCCLRRNGVRAVRRGIAAVDGGARAAPCAGGVRGEPRRLHRTRHCVRRTFPRPRGVVPHPHLKPDPVRSRPGRRGNTPGPGAPGASRPQGGHSAAETRRQRPRGRRTERAGRQEWRKSGYRSSGRCGLLPFDTGAGCTVTLRSDSTVGSAIALP